MVAIFAESILKSALLGFRGYFDLYNIPFEHISLYDFTEKKSPLKSGGMNRGGNISDFLEEAAIASHISDPNRSEAENFDNVYAEISAGRIDFAFVYWPELDGLLHRVGNLSPEISPKLRGYEARIQRLLEAAGEHYAEVRLYVFSDHGMANCKTLLELRGHIEVLPLQIGRDYAVVYDSTMARFWFFNEKARRMITKALQDVPEGRIVPDAELESLHCLFADRYFGDLIFLVREGVLIVPSYMGERPICAMHGYHPQELQSYAALLTNRSEIPEEITAIPHIYDLMVRDALLAKERNNSPNTPCVSCVSTDSEALAPSLAFSACFCAPNVEAKIL
jgi:predicted AlkP superfamily pyrophosphatase or phosphodiesterase